MRGYTVALVGHNGKYVSTSSQRFRLPAPTSFVTVQLIDPAGKYAGPVVVGGTSSVVITGVKAGTNLGKVVVDASKGYARLARRLARDRLDRGRWAYAHHGVPIGNGQNLGLVKSTGSKNGGTGPGQDEAHVGIPNEFNIAVPGEHMIKELALPKRYARVSNAFSGLAETSDVTSGPATGQWMSSLGGIMGETVNADVYGVTGAEIDAEMQQDLFISTVVNENLNASLVELDCNGLSYCSRNGTGEAWLNALSGAQPNQDSAFPAVSLDPTTGFGELVGPAVPDDGMLSPLPGGGTALFLSPRATSTQIGSGDVITTDTTVGGVTTETPQALGFVFETTPAITSYSDTAGDIGSVTYPDTTGLGSPDDPGNALKVAAGPNGDVVVTLTF